MPELSRSEIIKRHIERRKRCARLSAGNKNLSPEEIEKHREFTELCEPLMPAFRRYARSLTYTDPHTHAEDALQNALIDAYRFFHQFEPGTNFKAWVNTIIYNRYINVYRRNVKKRIVGQLSIDKVNDNGTDATSYLKELTVEAVEIRNIDGVDFLDTFSDEMRAAWNRLNPLFKEVIELCYIKQFTDYEVAEILQISNGTVKSRLHRGLRNLGKYMRPYREAQGLSTEKAKGSPNREKIVPNRKQKKEFWDNR